MKALLLALTAVIAVSGCDQLSGQKTAASEIISADNSKAGSPVQFEIRDFRLDKDSSDIGVTYKGRGTVVTRDPRLASGNFFVFLSVKQAHNNDEEQRMQVLLSDGIGTIRTYDYQRSAEKHEVVKYHDWKTFGYVPLLQGRIGNPAEANAAPQS